MPETPTVVLKDEETTYNQQTGEFDEYRPVEIRADDREHAKEIAEVFTEAWRDHKEA